MDAYNIKVITYELTGEQDIVIYKEPIQGKKPKEPDDHFDGNIQEDKPQSTIEEVLQKAKHSVASSLSRTKQTVYDYARANPWEYFLTFTFDPKKIDRHDYDKVTGKMSQWLNDTRKRKAPDMKYLVVPELHKDGAIHFHALMSDIGEIRLIDSGLKSMGLIIYNIPGFKWGFTTATKVKDTLKASNYITKYLTKDLTAQTKDKRRYWNSKNLEVGKVEKSFLDHESIALIQESYKADSKRHKKVEIARNDFQQEINYYTV